MTVLIVRLHATAIPKLCPQTVSSGKWNCAEIPLPHVIETNFDTSWKFQKHIYKLNSVHRFFGPRKYFTVCTSFSKFGCCKMLLLILPFSKAGINGDLHMAVFVCCCSSLQSTSPGNDCYRMIWLWKNLCSIKISVEEAIQPI